MRHSFALGAPILPHTPARARIDTFYQTSSLDDSSLSTHRVWEGMRSFEGSLRDVEN